MFKICQFIVTSSGIILLINKTLILHVYYGIMVKDTDISIQNRVKDILSGSYDLSESFNRSPTRAGNSLGLDFEAQVMASLMIQSNALISIKTVAQLCSISRQEIDRRIHIGTFPKPLKLSGEKKAIRKAFRLQDILEWLDVPSKYLSPNQKAPKLK